ncbi:8342_t:CDS:2 [Funneliformis caledonium]|uniref:8342_t:CDS:1 n=1 Tax=Funneliformis caledonium TaxID=1117310 RepID=A0A9N8V6Y2_9GLOM|nr:8342_t:CDS:2 [Funneliformis caledonium]
MEEVPESNENGESKPLEQKDIEDKPEWYEAHKIAIQVTNDQQLYADPVTGYTVMTELYHKSRGYCCGNKCRHCPFNYENVGKNIDLKALANKGSVKIDNEKKD